MTNFNIDYRKLYPSLTKNVNGEDIELTADEYEQVITEWEKNQAEAKILFETEQAKAAQKQAILDRLGLTEEEARLLLG